MNRIAIGIVSLLLFNMGLVRAETDHHGHKTEQGKQEGVNVHKKKLDRISKSLELTPNQRKKFEKAMNKKHNKKEASKKEYKGKKKAIKKKYNNKKMAIEAEFNSDVSAFLNAEQKKIFNEKYAKKKKKENTKKKSMKKTQKK